MEGSPVERVYPTAKDCDVHDPRHKLITWAQLSETNLTQESLANAAKAQSSGGGASQADPLSVTIIFQTDARSQHPFISMYGWNSPLIVSELARQAGNIGFRRFMNSDDDTFSAVTKLSFTADTPLCAPRRDEHLQQGPLFSIKLIDVVPDDQGNINIANFTLQPVPSTPSSSPSPARTAVTCNATPDCQGYKLDFGGMIIPGEVFRGLRKTMRESLYESVDPEQKEWTRSPILSSVLTIPNRDLLVSQPVPSASATSMKPLHEEYVCDFHLDHCSSWMYNNADHVNGGALIAACLQSLSAITARDWCGTASSNGSCIVTKVDAHFTRYLELGVDAALKIQCTKRTQNSSVPGNASAVCVLMDATVYFKQGNNSCGKVFLSALLDVNSNQNPAQISPSRTLSRL